jgi:hypothetical protein
MLRGFKSLEDRIEWTCSRCPKLRQNGVCDFRDQLRRNADLIGIRDVGLDIAGRHALATNEMMMPFKPLR